MEELEKQIEKLTKVNTYKQIKVLVVVVVSLLLLLLLYLLVGFN